MRLTIHFTMHETIVGGFDVHHSSGHPFGALLNSYAIARVTICALLNAMPYAVIVLATHQFNGAFMRPRACPWGSSCRRRRW
jgi:hypothetical protein